MNEQLGAVSIGYKPQPLSWKTKLMSDKLQFVVDVISIEVVSMKGRSTN